jgi:feruloyl esterase
MPQTGHGLSGTSYAVTGEGKTVPSLTIPNRYDQLGLLFEWVENSKVPSMSVPVTADDRSLPLCSYPSFPRYRTGPAGSANSYECATAPSQPLK